MDIDLEKWKYDLRHQRKNLVNWGLKPGEWVFRQCFQATF